MYLSCKIQEVLSVEEPETAAAMGREGVVISFLRLSLQSWVPGLCDDRDHSSLMHLQLPATSLADPAELELTHCLSQTPQ